MEGSQDCTVYRATAGTAVSAAGGYVDVWTTASVSDIPVIVEKLTSGRAIQLYGLDSRATYMGYVDKDVDIQKEDVVKVVAGELVDTFMRVLSINPIIDSDYMTLELIDTDEVPV